MSQVKIQGNASGTGVFTIAAPNSNTDRTLTLPNNTGTILTNASTGTILQVVSSAPTNLGQVTRASTTFGEISSSLRVTITPSSSSNLLLLEANICFDTAGNNSAIDHFKFFDVTNSAEVLIGDSNGSRTRALMASRSSAFDANDPVWMTFRAVVSAGSTSARTYAVYHRCEAASNRNFFGSSLTSSAGWQTAPVFTVMEIAG